MAKSITPNLDHFIHAIQFTWNDFRAAKFQSADKFPIKFNKFYLITLMWRKTRWLLPKLVPCPANSIVQWAILPDNQRAVFRFSFASWKKRSRKIFHKRYACVFYWTRTFNLRICFSGAVPRGGGWGCYFSTWVMTQIQKKKWWEEFGEKRSAGLNGWWKSSSKRFSALRFFFEDACSKGYLRESMSAVKDAHLELFEGSLSLWFAYAV